MTKYKGARVVRGPDWITSTADGGEECVGTAVQVNYNDDSVDVVWDTGKQLTYKTCDGNHTLRLLSNAPTGIIHKKEACVECRKESITGIRWICLACSGVNLCSTCYMADKHNTSHSFGRVDSPDASIVKVDARKKSRTVMAKGIFKHAKVVKGRDWEWGLSNGGANIEGEVQDICDWGPNSYSGGVRVRWANKNRTVERYRVGGDGKVDLMAVLPTDGFLYYKDHLPVIDLDSLDVGVFQIGDKVVIDLTAEELKTLQGRSWQDDMSFCIDNVGTVIFVPTENFVSVQYQNGSIYKFQKLMLKRIHRIEKGDLVRVMKDQSLALKLQQGHGGWSDHDLALGRLGRVIHIDDDGDVSVAIEELQHLLSPVCVDVVDPNNVPPHERVPSIPGNLHSVRLFDLSILDGNGTTQDAALQLSSLVKAASKGSIENVKRILPKTAVDVIEDGVTALQIACHKGHEKVVKYLLENRADIDIQDADGNTSLHFAVHGEKTAIIKLLLEHNVDTSKTNKEGQTAFHVAIAKEQISCISALVKGSCGVAMKDVSGDTAVHAAISTGQEKIFNAVMKSSNIKFETKNDKGYNMLQWAVFKNFKSAVEQILTKCSHALSDLVSLRLSNNGFTALHLAAYHNRKECAHLLITKGKMKLDVKDKKGQTPLHIAVSRSNLDIVQLLLEFDLNVNDLDVDGNSPLHLAIKRSSTVAHISSCAILIVCLLVEHEAKLTVKNKEGKTPLNLASNQQTSLFLERISKAVNERNAITSSGGIVLPIHWAAMDSEEYKLIKLDVKTHEEKAEHDNISNILLNGLPKARVVEVVRVQNGPLWQYFSLKKKQFTRKYGRGNENEVRLLHGTRSETVLKICKDNFDFRIAGENLSPMYGKGVYFATEPALSNHYCSDDEVDGLKHMLVARVLAGKMAYGSPDLLKPPDGYDCVCDYPSKPRIYCVFDHNQLYPEYIIKYR